MRYTGTHRGEVKVETDNKEVALGWLKEYASIAAKVIDADTGVAWSLSPSGEVMQLATVSTSHLPVTPRQFVRTSTHTYAILEVSKACYDEISGKLRAAAYTHAFQNGEDGAVIDMHGIALKQDRHG
jgi:hypothetical protein